MLFTCQAGFEDLLRGELAARGFGVPSESGAGWMRLVPEGRAAELLQPGQDLDLCFAHRAWFAPVELRGDGVNALAGRAVEWFTGSLRGEKIEGAWPCVWQAPIEVPGLGKRLGGVESEFAAQFKKRLSRVAKLASPDLPRGTGSARGLFAFAADFGRIFVTRDVWLGGQRRMADDSAAPSRSYLKTEEAFAVLGVEPGPGDTVVDLGAAPGGWSYSAAKRGAKVFAIDNGPLKGGALDNPLIEHRREDAFRFALPANERADWLFCDMVEDPKRVLELLGEWTRPRRCRKLVANLKFGHADALALLDHVRHSSASPLRPCRRASVRHLFHDREEFTIVAELAE